jgi:hypothetical protein
MIHGTQKQAQNIGEEKSTIHDHENQNNSPVTSITSPINLQN